MKRVVDQLRSASELNHYEFGAPRDLKNGITKIKVLAAPGERELARIHRARDAYQRAVNWIVKPELRLRRILLAARIESIQSEADRFSLRAGWVLGWATRDIGMWIKEGDALIYQIHPNRHDGLEVSLYAPAGGHVYAGNIDDIEEA
jgi:hypothetical protein